MKNLLKQKLSFKSKIGQTLLAKYDALLNQLEDINRKVTGHALDIAKVKEDLGTVQKLARDTSFEVEEIAQHLRRDCLEITGVAANEEFSAVPPNQLVM